MPFKTCLRAPEDKRRTGSSDNSGASQNNSKQGGRGEVPESSSTKDASPEVTSPKKKNAHGNRRKGGTPKQVYRKVIMPVAPTED